jgi:aminoglycoside 3'-phosphotransferase II
MSRAEDLVQAVLDAAGVRRDVSLQRMDHSESGDLVFRIDGAPPLFAKIGDPGRRISLAEMKRETAALRWLEGRAAAARLVWAGEAAGRPAMLTEALDGAALHALAPEKAEAGAIAALRALARLHALPVASCPFDERLAVKLAEARLRLSLGEIAIDRLEPENAATAPEAILAELEARRPLSEDLVVTHGDACWPNFILRPDGEVAIIDLGRFGVADRHQDLALFVRSARRNFPGLDVGALIARHYPVAADPEKLAYFRQLDELY